VDGSSTPISDVLKTASEAMGLSRKAQEWSVCQLWEAIAEPFRTMTRAQKISYHGHETVLDVQVSDTVTASMLQYQLPQLMAQLNHFSPQTGLTVDKISLSVAARDPR
jgi:Dna[CI] antecedent, DciA